MKRGWKDSTFIKMILIDWIADRDNSYEVTKEGIEEYIGSVDTICDEKTLDKYLNDLVEKKVLKSKEENCTKYAFNRDEFSDSETDRKEYRRYWEELRDHVLQLGELEMVDEISKNAMKEEPPLNDALKEKYKKRIKDNIQELDVEGDDVYVINKAINDGKEISFNYMESPKASDVSGIKEKKKTVFPISVFISRDYRGYLFAAYKNDPPIIFNMSRIQKGSLQEIKNSRECFTEDEWKKWKQNHLDNLKQRWDIDGEEAEVEIAVDKKKDIFGCGSKLKKVLGDPVEEDDKEAVYKGRIYGINGFMSFIRENIYCCRLIGDISKSGKKVNKKREDLINAMQEKKNRYEQLQREPMPDSEE
ncbi:MAG: WYL domain-containing protein [Clostridiales bacterium]|nr:WYL domain-containing protein [Clostridiales bacterium]